MFDYALLSLEPSSVPREAALGTWHRYVIGNKITTITGYRIGSAEEVAEHARACILRLNAKHHYGRRV